MKKLSLAIYDEFKCLAGECPLTCCKGWAIRADGGIYDKWKEDAATSYLCDKVTCKREDGQDIYYMKCDDTKTCVMLDCNGLCEIVKKHGEANLSDTCHTFPRKKNIITENPEEDEVILSEHSLSGACPAVIDMINDRINHDKSFQIVDINKIINDDTEALAFVFPMEYRIRNEVIKLIQRDDFKLTDKLMLAFSFLQECLECEWEEDVDDCIEVYNDKENLLELVELFSKDFAGVTSEEAFQEICQTYYDVTEFYKEEVMYRPHLYDNAVFVEELYPSVDSEESKNLREDTLEDWSDFKKDFESYDKLFEQIIISEVFADCVSDDIGYIVEAYQAVVFEYIMTRLSAFLSRKEQYEDVKMYICLFVRAIGHNTEGMAEYWEENFDDSILDKEYFYLLLR